MAEEENYKPALRARFQGRRRIYSKYETITAENVVSAVDAAIPDHLYNHGQINYLLNYVRGSQPILGRVKDVRPEICNRIVENHAEEILTFKVGYQLSEPVQYVSRMGEDDSKSDETSNFVKELNSMVFSEDKASLDHDLFEWMCIAGLGYRMTLPDESDDVEDGSAPFEMYTLDPRSAFVAYSREYHHKPVFACYITIDVDNVYTYTIYTKTKVYTIYKSRVVSEQPNTVGLIPIVEYDLNSSMIGAFESVMPLLDAVNLLESNRLDGVEQTVQALIKFINCDISEEDFVAMLQLGAVKVDSHDGVQGDVDVIKNDLDQSQTQVTKDDLYSSIVRIAGVPNLNGTSGSSSDTGAAVLLRDGWTIAEAHAKSYELKFKKAERETLRIALRIANMAGEKIKLRIRDIDMAFNRRNYENIQVKSQVLTTMLASGKIHPLLAFQSCGLFTDPEAAYLMSEKWLEEQDEKAAESAQAGYTAPSTQGVTGEKYNYVQHYEGVGERRQKQQQASEEANE